MMQLLFFTTIWRIVFFHRPEIAEEHFGQVNNTVIDSQQTITNPFAGWSLWQEHSVSKCKYKSEVEM